MHLDADQVQRLLHGELSGAEAAVRAHLAACAECRAGVDAAEREEANVHALLRHLDHPPPATDVRTLITPRGWLRWAAGLALLFGLGGVAYAAPGSPLPAWIHALAGMIAPGQPEDVSPAGIAVAPGQRLVIAFSRRADGWVEVALSDGGDVVVRAPVGAATYTSDAERLVIDNADSDARFAIDIPRRAPRVEITVAGSRVFLKEGARAGGDPPARCVATDGGRFRCSLGGR